MFICRRRSAERERFELDHANSRSPSHLLGVKNVQAILLSIQVARYLWISFACSNRATNRERRIAIAFVT